MHNILLPKGKQVMKTIPRSMLVTLFIFVIALSSEAGNIVGTVKAKGVKNSADAVIYIEKISGKTFSPPKEHAKMDQKNLKFHPHVLPILAGTTVDFQNSDDVLHNVFSPDACADKMNLGTWPKGQSRSYTYKNPGCVTVMLCNVHPEMEAYVLALETPYFAVSAVDGKYEIKDVPAGKYDLKIWHEKLKAQIVSVTVPEKGDVTIDFEIHK
jgi:plastocyanin